MFAPSRPGRQRKRRVRVPWSHHSQEVKDALRATGVRPVAKLCFANSQRFLIGARAKRLPLARHLVYHEGWAADAKGVMFEHAWLTLRGAVLDLTLSGVRYLRSRTYTAARIVENIAEHNAYTWVDADALRKIQPRTGRAYAHRTKHEG